MKKNTLSTNLEYKGLLIAAEGSDGSGKSTQVQLLSDWLRSQGFATVITSWGSSEIIRPLIKKIKKDEIIIPPEVFSLLHAADFSERYEKIILPSLKAGFIVLCDRYIYTAYARDKARTLNSPWIENLYNFAIKPDLSFYFKVSPEIAISRKINMPKFYEAGMDMNLEKNIKKSFELFMRTVNKNYEELLNPHGIITIDGEKEIFMTLPHLKAYVKKAIQKKYNVSIS